jgi:hypothetical protein
MGWRWYTDEFNYPPVLVAPGMLRQEALPAYSTDERAAFELIEHMRKRGWRSKFRIGLAAANYSALFARDGELGEKRCEAAGNTLAHAICLAALKAVGVGTP